MVEAGVAPPAEAERHAAGGAAREDDGIEVTSVTLLDAVVVIAAEPTPPRVRRGKTGQTIHRQVSPEKENMSSGPICAGREGVERRGPEAPERLEPFVDLGQRRASTA